ncbi:hypothetical protein FOL47_000564 [Perkinsus chesapeaki]|uniref:Uncharacterized protein n=1 Tax=Perkinsus chesapeaki TaxID=330153 RepID=A0A7J6N133_PERCH|nr:hypothetical protein FOL47_000564 [Perkinsus chesapeaki]
MPTIMPHTVVPVDTEIPTCIHVSCIDQRVTASDHVAEPKFRVVVGYYSGIVEQFDLVVVEGQERGSGRFATGPSLQLNPHLEDAFPDTIRSLGALQATVVLPCGPQLLFIGYEGLGLHLVDARQPSKRPQIKDIIIHYHAERPLTDVKDAQLWEPGPNLSVIVVAITSEWSRPEVNSAATNGRVTLYRRSTKRNRSNKEGCQEAYSLDLFGCAYALAGVPYDGAEDDRSTSREILRGDRVKVAVALRASCCILGIYELFKVTRDGREFSSSQLTTINTTYPIACLSWSPDRAHLAGVSDGGELLVWSQVFTKSDREGTVGEHAEKGLVKVIGHEEQSELESTLWLSDNRIVASGAGDCLVLLSFSAPARLRVLRKQSQTGHCGTTSCLAFCKGTSPRGNARTGLSILLTGGESTFITCHVFYTSSDHIGDIPTPSRGKLFVCEQLDRIDWGRSQRTINVTSVKCKAESDHEGDNRTGSSYSRDSDVISLLRDAVVVPPPTASSSQPSRPASPLRSVKEFVSPSTGATSSTQMAESISRMELARLEKLLPLYESEVDRLLSYISFQSKSFRQLELAVASNQCDETDLDSRCSMVVHKVHSIIKNTVKEEPLTWLLERLGFGEEANSGVADDSITSDEYLGNLLKTYKFLQPDLS